MRRACWTVIAMVPLLCLGGYPSTVAAPGGERATYREGRAWLPPGGAVPKQKVAIQIAEAVLGPIYGSQAVRSARPFRAVLRRGIWTVTGHLRRPASYQSTNPRAPNFRIYFGGAAHVEVARKDGRILNIDWPK
ncbi:MAG TPA: NTF2 fold immunity protein [Armatimonadota bacterium]|jgi:hypothetical protein